MRRVARIGAGLVLGTVLASGVPARAEPPELRVAATVLSDYVHRGFSRSDADPVLQLAASLRGASGWFVGLRASGVDFAGDGAAGEPRRLELRSVAGWGRALGERWAASVAVVRYEYPGASGYADTDYTELHLAVGFRDTLLATFVHSPHFFGHTEARMLEVSGRTPLAGAWDLVGGVGVSDVPFFGEQHVYGHAGLGWAAGPWSIDAAVYAADGPAVPSWGEIVDGRLVVGLRWSLR